MNDLKYRKKQKKSIKGTKFYKTALTYGTYGLYILENGQLTLNQLEAIRKKLSIVFKNSKYWSVLPEPFPKTSKTIGSRMGSGKGEVYTYVYNLLKGTVILEWNQKQEFSQLLFFRLLPVKLCIIKKSL